ncbi:MAG: glutathione peroxidase [Nitrospinae bacterium]|nr:glutathione peroxidase [Nitrospinota bacterium]
MEKNVYGFKAKSIDGREISLGEFRGKTLLIVNVASQCGFTPQYAGLEALYGKYKDEGLVVLGFPCNQFGGQEPGSESEIKSFCETNFQVTFPLFAKINVNGPGAHPLYQHLKKKKRGILFTKRIKWNFTKFLVDRYGRVVKRYGPAVKPEAIAKDVSTAIGVR